MNGNTVYFPEVGLGYPKELHDLHNDNPLALEVMNAKANVLSEKQAEISKLLNGNEEPKDDKTEKLILNPNDRNKYIVHIRTYQFYLNWRRYIQQVKSNKKREEKKTYIQFGREKERMLGMILQRIYSNHEILWRCFLETQTAIDDIRPY